MKFIKRFLSNSKRERHALRNLDSSIEFAVKKQYLHNQAMGSNTSLISSENNETPIIVSLTTYSKRIHDVYLVIQSLGEQTKKAQSIILWLDENEFDFETIPLTLKKQANKGLDIRFCTNLYSYKKIIPSLIEFTNSDIITVDDDFLYPHDLIETLLKGKSSHPNSIVGIRSHKIKISEDKPLPYKQWGFESCYSENGKYTFLTTGAGTLFPATIDYKPLCAISDFMSICPNADDVWINFMCIKHGIPRIKVADDRKFRARFLQLEEHQDIALNNQNVHNYQNDLQIQAIVEKYKINLKDII